MSSHPGSDLNAAVELACYLRDMHLHPEQVQDFYPTPGTLSTCMFFTGLDPRTMQPVFVPRTPQEKGMQRALLQYSRPENQPIVRKALRLCNREDLIGYGPKCLVPPGNVDSYGTSNGRNARGMQGRKPPVRQNNNEWHPCWTRSKPRKSRPISDKM